MQQHYFVLLSLCAWPWMASAQQATEVPQYGDPPAQRRFFLDVARASSDVGLASVGVQWSWAWRRSLMNGELTGHWEAHIARWRVPAGAAEPGEQRLWTQFAVVPVVRWRPDQGRSAWFVEGGIGASVMDGHYITRHKAFSTHFNFTDHVGVGWSFGAQRQHELVLIARHVSNGGIRKPNPGEEFVQLRYSRSF